MGDAYPSEDMIHDFGKGGGDDGREGVCEFERLRGDGDDDGPGAVAVELLGTGKEPGGRARVGER